MFKKKADSFSRASQCVTKCKDLRTKEVGISVGSTHFLYIKAKKNAIMCVV